MGTYITKTRDAARDQSVADGEMIDYVCRPGPSAFRNVSSSKARLKVNVGTRDSAAPVRWIHGSFPGMSRMLFAMGLKVHCYERGLIPKVVMEHGRRRRRGCEQWAFIRDNCHRQSSPCVQAVGTCIRCH